MKHFKWNSFSFKCFFSSLKKVKTSHRVVQRLSWRFTMDWGEHVFCVFLSSEEINICYDEYYPIHQAVLHDQRFVDLLITHGAFTDVKTYTQQMTLLHVIFLLGKKSADDTLEIVKALLNRGLKEHINTPDSLGNTPLHALIVRWIFEVVCWGIKVLIVFYI